jgi:thioredoxin reductase
MSTKHHFDVIIVGGSYSGLSAAMALGRSLRDVLVIDSNNPCNQQTPHSHNFLTQDGEAPAAIAERAKSQVLNYPTVTLMQGKAIKATKHDQGFVVQLETEETVTGSKLLLATGITDMLPQIPGLSSCWGISVLHCPYCHGYEVVGKEWGILADGEAAYHFCMILSNWTKKLVLFTNGPCNLTEEQKQKLKQKGIKILESTLQLIEHTNGQIEQLHFEDGNSYPLTVLYLKAPFKQKSEIPEQLGCELTEQGHLKTDDMQRTTVAGMYAAGDNSNMLRSVSMAVASGTKAGAVINMDLVTESF